MLGTVLKTLTTRGAAVLLITIATAEFGIFAKNDNKPLH